LAPVLFALGFPAARSWPMLAASTSIHCVYITALTNAYDSGDFSLAYPLARGGGAVVAALGGAAILGDSLPGLAWVGIAVVAIGLASTARPLAARATLAWAGVTALTIGAYTIVDTVGSRRADGTTYGLALFFCVAIAFSVVGVARGKGRALLQAIPASWWRFIVAGVASNLAYTLVLIAVRHAPVGYVATLRESSVVLGALAGWFFLKERLARARVVSSVVVLGGMALLIVGR
jgi:multidrug transporter EmrE-like cation transporter